MAAASITSIVFTESGDSLGAALVRLVLALKSLAWRNGLVDAGVDSQAPLQLDDGEARSLGLFAIVEYLEDRYRRLSLFPEAPAQRAFVRYSLDVSRAALELPRRPLAQLGRHDLSLEEQAREAADEQLLQATLGRLEVLLAEQAPTPGAFAIGSAATLTDLLVVVLARALRMRRGDLAGFDRVQRVFASVGQMPSVEQAYARRTAHLVDDMRPELRDRYLERVSDVLGPWAGKMRLLDTIGWSRRTEESFLQSGCDQLPDVEYDVDRDQAQRAIAELSELLVSFNADHVLVEWLRSQVQSFIDAYRMVLAVGTKDFYALSLELYGGARTTAFDRNTTNLDLADHVVERLGRESRFVESDALDTDQFVAFLQAKLAARTPRLELAIVRDPSLNAKVICGATRLRVREGASFGRAEAEGLWLHEIETHALTAQNGALQSRYPLLKAGGPRTTRTQEGLAVFSELYGRAMSSPRLSRIAERVRLVGLAEDGASFVDLHRYLTDRGASPREAYLDAARICRGGVVSGGAPFTKDACYLAGLVDIYGLLRRALRFRSPLLGELLVSGRVHQNDLPALLWLRQQGVISAPTFLPGWVEQWDGMLSYFAFTSFLHEIEIDVTTGVSDDLSELFERSIESYDRTRRPLSR